METRALLQSTTFSGTGAPALPSLKHRLELRSALLTCYNSSRLMLSVMRSSVSRSSRSCCKRADPPRLWRSGEALPSTPARGSARVASAALCGHDARSDCSDRLGGPAASGVSCALGSALPGAEAGAALAERRPEPCREWLARAARPLQRADASAIQLACGAESRFATGSCASSAHVPASGQNVQATHARQ
jgi:hypothetical protein